MGRKIINIENDYLSLRVNNVLRRLVQFVRLVAIVLEGYVSQRYWTHVLMVIFVNFHRYLCDVNNKKTMYQLKQHLWVNGTY